MVFSWQLILPIVLFPRMLSIHLGTPIVSVCYHFFPRMQCDKQEFTFLFLFFLQEIRLLVLVSYKLEPGVCLIIPDVSRKFSPAFQKLEAAFERWSTKVVVQQRMWPQVQNSDIEKCIFMTASKNKYLWKHSWMTASLKQLQRYIHLKNSTSYTYFTFLKLTSC